MRSIFYILIFLLVGCEEIVEFNTNATHDPSIVVSSYFSPLESPGVYVTHTQPAYYSYAPRLNDIQASIECVNSGNAYILSPTNGIGHINFSSDEMVFSEGGIYKVIVTQNNTITHATDTIPYPASIHGVTVHPISNDFSYQVSLSINPSAHNFDNNFFEVAVYLAEVWDSSQEIEFYENPNPLKSFNPIITREDYYPDLMLIGSGHPETLLFRIEGSAKTVKIDFQYETSSSWNPLTGYFFPEHYVKVEMRSVSKAYFNYKTSLYRQKYAMEGDFLYGIAPPVTVISNILGGYGVFAGYSKTDTVLHVPSRSIDG